MSQTCPRCGRSMPSPRIARARPAPPTRDGCAHCGQAGGDGPSEWRTGRPRIGMPPETVGTDEHPRIQRLSGELPPAGLPPSATPPARPPVARGGGRWVVAGAAVVGAAAVGVWFLIAAGGPTPTAPDPAVTPDPPVAAGSSQGLPAEPRAATRADAAPPPLAGAGDWPERFSERALWLAFEAALSQGSVRGVLNAIDCTPRPCVVFGRLHDGVDAVRLLDAPALAPYLDDRRFIYRWNEPVAGAAEGSLGAAHFALAFLPKDLDATTRADLQRSVDRRTEARRRPPDAAVPSPAPSPETPATAP